MTSSQTRPESTAPHAPSELHSTQTLGFSVVRQMGRFEGQSPLTSHSSMSIDVGGDPGALPLPSLG